MVHLVVEFLASFFLHLLFYDRSIENEDGGDDQKQANDPTQCAPDDHPDVGAISCSPQETNQPFGYFDPCLNQKRFVNVTNPQVYRKYHDRILTLKLYLIEQGQGYLT